MLSFYVYILQNNGFTCIGLLIYGYAKTICSQTSSEMLGWIFIEKPRIFGCGSLELELFFFELKESVVSKTPKKIDKSCG